MNRPDTIPLGELPAPGVVPKRMASIVIRAERYGEPKQAMRMEELPVPEFGADEVLLGVAAAGINYNNVWASSGSPLDLIALRRKQGSVHDFHVGGSEASGIVCAIGANVRNVKLGDEVVVHGGVWDPDDAWIREGGDVVLSKTFRAWGYETNWGSFAQFAVVRKEQCLPRPQNISWEESAVFMLTGATVQRMLFRWSPNELRPGEPVLIWGGAGGLGVMAIQAARLVGALPVAVVNSEEKKTVCKELGAVGAIDRSNYNHWGILPGDDMKSEEYRTWKKGVNAFLQELYECTGGRAPTIVVEHPGADTLPTSLFVCSRGGMVVTCGATSGFLGSFDLRYLWVHQKRLQGSHFASADECRIVNDLVREGTLKPVLSRTFSFEEIPTAHQMMLENCHPYGNMAARIGCS